MGIDLTLTKGYGVVIPWNQVKANVEDDGDPFFTDILNDLMREYPLVTLDTITNTWRAVGEGDDSVTVSVRRLAEYVRPQESESFVWRFPHPELTPDEIAQTLDAARALGYTAENFEWFVGLSIS